MQNRFGNLNIGRRHSNVQKGVQQNGIANKNVQKDELSWRRGKGDTSDVQENVKQSGIGKMNDKSLRRINEMIRNLFHDENGKKWEDKKSQGYGHRRRNNRNKPTSLRRDGVITVNQNKIAKRKSPFKPPKRPSSSELEPPKRSMTDENILQMTEEKVNALKSMLCKSIPSLCNTTDMPSRRGMNKVTQDKITQIGDRNVNSQMSVIQNASPLRNNRRHQSIIDEYDEVVFLPNYQIVLK